MAEDTARVARLRKKSINGQSMKRLVEAGLIWLRTNQHTVNALNVFPVPDGDTGTNMVLTMQSAWNEIKDLGHRKVSDMAAGVSKGALMGAPPCIADYNSGSALTGTLVAFRASRCALHPAD